MYKVLGADGQEYGPISAEQLRQWIAERRLNSQSLLQPEGQSGWKPLSFFPEFAPELAQVSPLPPPASTAGLAPTNSMAIASLVMGIASWVCCINFGIFNVLGLIFGFVALSQLRTNPHQGGKALAVAGLVLSGAGLLVSVMAIVLGLTAQMFEVIRNW